MVSASLKETANCVTVGINCVSLSENVLENGVAFDLEVTILANDEEVKTVIRQEESPGSVADEGTKMPKKKQQKLKWLA